MPMKSTPEKAVEASRSRYETERLSERLRELRLGRKLTISRLAELSKVPASTISKIGERAVTAQPRPRDQPRPRRSRENLEAFSSRGFASGRSLASWCGAQSATRLNILDMGLTLQGIYPATSSYPVCFEARLGILARGAHIRALAQ